jgi:hypothetical protein
VLLSPKTKNQRDPHRKKNKGESRSRSKSKSSQGSQHSEHRRRLLQSRQSVILLDKRHLKDVKRQRREILEATELNESGGMALREAAAAKAALRSGDFPRREGDAEDGDTDPRERLSSFPLGTRSLDLSKSLNLVTAADELRLERERIEREQLAAAAAKLAGIVPGTTAEPSAVLDLVAASISPAQSMSGGAGAVDQLGGTTIAVSDDESPLGDSPDPLSGRRSPGALISNLALSGNSDTGRDSPNLVLTMAEQQMAFESANERSDSMGVRRGSQFSRQTSAMDFIGDDGPSLEVHSPKTIHEELGEDEDESSSSPSDECGSAEEHINEVEHHAQHKLAFTNMPTFTRYQNKNFEGFFWVDIVGTFFCRFWVRVAHFVRTLTLTDTQQKHRNGAIGRVLPAVH